MELEKVKFLGLSISIFEKIELINFITKNIINNEQKIYYGYSLGAIAYLRKHPEIYYYGEKSDVFVTDGRIFYILAKKQGLKLKYEISIPNFVFLTLELANENKWSVFLLGSEEETNKNAQKKIKELYPDIPHINGHHGYFKQSDQDSLLNEINRHRHHIILIGMSSPHKEKIALMLREQTKVNIIIPCGGMIDVLAGKTNLTPNWAKKIGLASLYRLLQEPKRLFKRYFFIYTYLFFSFFPKYLFFVIIKGDKNYSVLKESKNNL